MRITTHIIVSNHGNVRVNKTGTGIKPNEIDITLNLTIPDKFFRRPTPIVNLELPSEAITEVRLDEVISLNAMQIAGSIGVSVDDVRDAMVQMRRSVEEEGGMPV